MKRNTCLLLIALIVAGCMNPQADYVAADRANFDDVGADYLRYIEADQTLTPEQRQANRTFGLGLNWANGYGTHAQGGVYDWRIDPGHPTVTTLAIANELTALNWVPGEERHGDPDIDTVTYDVRDKTLISSGISETYFFEVFADRYPSKHSIRTQNHRARSIQIYGIGEKTGTTSGTSVYTFNAFGTGLVENQFKPIGSPQSVAISTAETSYVTVDPSPTTQPSNPTPPSPPTTEFSEHGVQMTYTCAVVTWTWTWG